MCDINDTRCRTLLHIVHIIQKYVENPISNSEIIIIIVKDDNNQQDVTEKKFEDKDFGNLHLKI